MRLTYIRVQHGEHLSTIVASFGTTAEAVLAANGLSGPEEVRPGIVLVIPAAREQQVGSTPAPAPPTSPAVPVSGVIRHGPGNRKAVALTFEASFGRGKVEQVLESLRLHRCPGTWFLTGEWADRFPALGRRISQAGQQVELHGHRHAHFRELTPGQIREDIRRAIASVQAICGRRPQFLRPPFGSVCPAAEAAAAQSGLRLVLWSVDSLDWQNPGTDEIAARVLGGVHPGAIVLMHAVADQAPAALERIIPGLRSAGYELVTLDRLLGARTPAYAALGPAPPHLGR